MADATYDVALAAGLQLVDHFRPYVAEIEIAGSVRRRRARVKDLEIVVCLSEDRDVRLAEHRLGQGILAGMQNGLFSWSSQLKRRGTRYNRFCMEASVQRLEVDFFIADAQNYGNTLAIRTGDADFSQMLVDNRRGLMPTHLRQQDGYLWCCSAEDGHVKTLVPCRTEADYFATLGLRWIEPALRTRGAAWDLLSERRLAI